MSFAERIGGLPAEARAELYKNTRSFYSLEARLNRGWSRTGWVLAAVAGAWGSWQTAARVLYPIEVHDVRYTQVDLNSGWVGDTVKAMDAPKLFTPKVERTALTNYILARERYVPQIDKTNWEQVKAMSSLPVWNQYTEWLDSRQSPKRAIGAEGYIDIVMPLAFGEPLKSGDGTITYQVRFFRRIVRGGAASPQQSCNTEVSFQWHPGIAQNNLHATLNDAGFQAVSYRLPECS